MSLLKSLRKLCFICKALHVVVVVAEPCAVAGGAGR
jgi:hypothetical protein